ncbi:uncharacterized protein [Periplaneta americana]|uniref:uncharacterized protein isoform X1 n=1 Tax=Periplaneta americana TaxID=6978 RepID=UPI0037E91862
MYRACSVTRACAQAQVAPESSSSSRRRMSRQSVVDLAVALVSIPLLVVFGLMLETNMQDDWTENTETRFYVLGLGMALLFVSILVCGYVTHRLGICIWAAQQPQSSQQGQRSNDSRTATDSQLHLVVSGELPPSYESVVKLDAPPPYCSVLVIDEKAKQTTTG